MAALIVLALLIDVLIAALLRAEQVRAAVRGGACATRCDMASCRWARPWPPPACCSRSPPHSMGLAALLVFAAPLLVTQVAFRRYAGIRATYLQTVRALSGSPRSAATSSPATRARVSRLAVAVGRELGMAEPELLELEYAALMHDIGQLSLSDPIPGGATVLASRPSAPHRRAGRRGDQADRACWTGWPSWSRRQCEPPMRPSRPAAGQPDHQGGQRLRRPGRRLGSTATAPARPCERLRLDAGSEYDPDASRGDEARGRSARRPQALEKLQKCAFSTASPARPTRRPWPGASRIRPLTPHVPAAVTSSETGAWATSL